ncbi:hypothetical protein [Radicibacter daui]|uniref:hypothetical protein n=1 Tax=Radicibacter daui TaxID=3064829 RepID=UPI00404699A6
MNEVSTKAAVLAMLAFALGVGATVLCIIGASVIDAIFSLSKSDWAAWVQAVGSIGAIIGAIWISRHEIRVQRRQRDIEHNDRMRRVALNVWRTLFSKYSEVEEIKSGREEVRFLINQVNSSRAAGQVPSFQTHQQITRLTRELREKSKSIRMTVEIIDELMAARTAAYEDALKIIQTINILGRFGHDVNNQGFEKKYPAFIALYNTVESRLEAFRQGDNYPKDPAI